MLITFIKWLVMIFEACNAIPLSTWHTKVLKILSNLNPAFMKEIPLTWESNQSISNYLLCGIILLLVANGYSVWRSFWRSTNFDNKSVFVNERKKYWNRRNINWNKINKRNIYKRNIVKNFSWRIFCEKILRKIFLSLSQ